MLKKSNKEVGSKGEKEAAAFLKKSGYKILKMNYTCKLGEIDIVALEKQTLVFVEVKVRHSDIYGAPEFAVTAHKQRQIIKVAEIYLSRNRITNTDCRFDVVAISYHQKDGGVHEINLLKDAFRVDRY